MIIGRANLEFPDCRFPEREHEFLICYYPNGSGKGAVGLKLGISCKRGVKQGNIQARTTDFGKSS